MDYILKFLSFYIVALTASFLAVSNNINTNSLDSCIKEDFSVKKGAVTGPKFSASTGDSLDVLISIMNKKETKNKFTTTSYTNTNSIIPFSYPNILPPINTKKNSLVPTKLDQGNQEKIQDKLIALAVKEDVLPSVEAVAAAAFLAGRRGAIRIP